MARKVIITVAQTGAFHGKDANPNLPITPEEIAQSAYDCYNAGAAIVHIHVRDDEGKPSYDIDKYHETIERIRAHKDCDVCINITSSGKENGDDEERIRPIRELLPELASFDCGSLNWQHRSIFENHPRFLEKLGTELKELNVKPEIEIFDAGMVYK